MLKPKSYQHIIWDWNGTLINDTWLFVDIMNNVLKNKEMNPITIKKYRNIFGFPVKDYYIKLGFNLKKESFKKSGMEFINAYKKRRYEADLYPNVKIMLNKLNSISITHSILSAQHQKLLNDLIKHYEIKKYFKYIKGLNNYYATSKIKEGKTLIKKIGLDPKYVLLIGDTNHDYEVSQKLNIDCLLISHGHHSHYKLLKTGVPVVKNIKDIFQIFNLDYP